MTLILLLSLLVLGLAFGSFINALVWRMHHNATGNTKKKLSAFRGRSMCIHCKKTLTARDLIPVYSWLRLRGKCRYCNQRIEDTPLAELLVPALFVLSYISWPLAFDASGVLLFVLWLIVLVILSALFVYDLRWMLLPNKLTLVFIVLATTMVVVRTVTDGVVVIPQALFGAASVGGTFYILHKVSKGTWIGGGDVKLGVGIGLLVGNPLLGFMTIFIASLTGSLVAIPQLVSKKITMSGRLPFGPFLIIATILTFLFHAPILQWYQGLFLVI